MNNKKIVFLLVLLILIYSLIGCQKEMPDGIESKSFLKDMDELYDLVDKSMVDREYYKEDIDKILDKMNEKDYQKKLNDYEISIYVLAKETLIKVENDLTTGKKMIQSYTFDEIELISEMLGY